MGQIEIPTILQTLQLKQKQKITKNKNQKAFLETAREKIKKNNQCRWVEVLKESNTEFTINKTNLFDMLFTLITHVQPSHKEMRKKKMYHFCCFYMPSYIHFYTYVTFRKKIL